MTATNVAGTYRVFFALWPDPATARTIASACTTRCDAVVVEDLHLTLVFIGAVDATAFERLPMVAQGLRCAPFDLRLDRTEYWAGPRVHVAVPRVVPVALVDLRAQLCRRLADAGIGQSRPVEAEYRPHVSLTRGGASRPSQAGALPPVVWQVTAVTLAVTEPVPGGAHYRRAASVPLGGVDR